MESGIIYFHVSINHGIWVYWHLPWRGGAGLVSHAAATLMQGERADSLAACSRHSTPRRTLPLAILLCTY